MRREAPEIAIYDVLSVTEETRALVWNDLVDAARLGRYYQSLAKGYRRKQNIIHGALLLSATAGFATLFEFMPDWAQPLSAVFVAVFVVWEAVAKYPGKVAMLESVASQCGSLETEGHDLWASASEYRIKEDRAMESHRYLSRRLDEITGWPGKLDISDDESLNGSVPQILDRWLSETLRPPTHCPEGLG